MNRIQAFFRLALALGAFAATAHAATAQTATRLPFMRGVNINQLETYAYGGTHTSYLGLDSTYSDIRSKGFDHVRLPVDFRKYYDAGSKTLKTSGSYKITDIDTVINKALAAGLYVTLDFHGFKDTFAYDSDPDTEGTDAYNFVMTWRLLAERYRDYPDTLNFELVNEPWAHAYNPNSKIDKLQARAYAAIRQTNPTRLVLWASSDGNKTWLLDNLTLPADASHLAVVIHIYAPEEFTHQGATWADSSYTSQVRLADAHRSKLWYELNNMKNWMAAHPDIPMVVNEFAVRLAYAEQNRTGARDDLQEYLSTVRAFCESNSVPWAYWQYCDEGNAEFGLRARYNGAWREYVIDALFPPGWDAPEPVPPSVAEAHGYDWTNRVFTVTGLAPGAEVTLDVWAAGIQESLFADAFGAATFFVPTAPGALYAFAVATNGVVLASGEFLAGAWDPEGSWFSAAPDGAGGSAEVGGGWTTPPAATNSARYALGAATAFALAPSSSAAGAGRLVHADFAIRYDFLNDASLDLGSISAGESIAAVTAVANAVGGAARWRALVGGAWSDMTCDIAPAPDVDYLLRLEGDFTLAAPRVRLLVSADGGAGFVPLRSADGGDEWFAPNDARIATLSEIATVGKGESALLRGTLSNAYVAEANGVRYTSLADALRAAGRGGAVTLLANATAPRSLAVGRAIETNGHLLLTYDDTNFTLFLLQ